MSFIIILMIPAAERFNCLSTDYFVCILWRVVGRFTKKFKDAHLRTLFLNYSKTCQRTGKHKLVSDQQINQQIKLVSILAHWLTDFHGVNQVLFFVFFVCLFVFTLKAIKPGFQNYNQVNGSLRSVVIFLGRKQ